MLMAGVVSLANASNILQVAFAAAYVILNGIYWAVSALNPFKYHWRHAYETQVLNIAPLPEGQDHPAKDKGHVKKLIRRSRQGWHRFQISWGLIDPAKPVPLKTDRKTAAGGNFTAALWTAIVLTGTSQWLNEATTIAPMNDAWKKWLREAETNAQPERRFKIHPAPNISHVFQRVQRMPTGIDWRFIRAATDPKADHDRRTFIRKQIESWDAGTRLTQILAEHAPMTRKPTTYEIDTTVDPVEASSASAQGTSPADGALQDAANLGRRPANVPNTTIPAESDVQIILSSPDDVEKLVEEPSSC